MLKILAASLGILFVSRLPTLPSLPQPVWLSITLAGTVITLLLLHSRSRWAGCFCLGAVWGIVAGQQLLSQQLPQGLAGEELLISGVVSDLPQHRGDFQRFEFTVDDYLNLSPHGRERALPERIMLSWYGQQSLRVAQRWTLLVKLRRPRGFVNSGGFDYQRWLLSEGIGATGYVRTSSHNHLHGLMPGYPVQKQRQRVRDWLTGRFDSPVTGLLLALAIGDTSAIRVEQWNLLRDTGTIHLMAISGLHIGLAALLGFWLGHALRAGFSMLRVSLSFGYWLPGFISCTLAGLYSAMAGFALPTQRALVMVLLVHLALLTSRFGSSPRALAWAMLIVLFIDPLAGYALGFWLSFGAVTLLLFHFQHRQWSIQRVPKMIRSWLNFGRAQWVVSLGLIVPLLALNQPLSLLTPLANAVAIPVVSFGVVAPLLGGLLLNFLGIAGADGLANLAVQLLSLCVTLLEWLVRHLNTSGWYPSGAIPSVLAYVAAGVGVLLLLAPRGLPARWLGLLLLMPLLLPRGSDRPPLVLTVLDVGQGLAVVVRTENRVLVYDTGPAYSERFNAGDAILWPYLRSQGIHHVDRLIISHGDTDHAGGTEAFLARVAVDEIISGEVLPALDSAYPALPVSPCDSNRDWQWDDVSLQLIEPFTAAAGGSNDQSCILLVEYAGQRILIPGDIEAGVEKHLLTHGQLPADVTVLIAPHHGSATSSTPDFVKQVHAGQVVYSTGYRNRYGHPHPRVVARYEATGSRAYNIADTGQLSFTWDSQGELRIEPLRETERHYWFD
jgi:competence protein ComEC